MRLIITFFHFHFLKSHLSIANVWVKLPPEFPRPLVHLERQRGLFREKIKCYFAEIDLPKFLELPDPCYAWKGREDCLACAVFCEVFILILVLQTKSCGREILIMIESSKPDTRFYNIIVGQSKQYEVAGQNTLSV